MTWWQDRLADLHASATESPAVEPVPWARVHRRAGQVTTTMLALDGAGLTLDMIHDMQIDGDLDKVAAAFTHWSPTNYPEGWDPGQLAELDVARLASFHQKAKGFAMELEVDSAIAAGDIDMPDGASHFALAERGTEAVDGCFLDEHGEIVQAIQIKATKDVSYIAGTLRDHPDIPIYTNTEAAEAAADRGLDDVVDAGRTLPEVFPADAEALADTVSTSLGGALDELVPQLTLAMVGATLAVTYFTGGDMEQARAQASRRAGRATGINLVGTALSTITGVESARLAVAGTVTAVGLARSTVERRLSPTLSRLSAYQDVLGDLGTVHSTPERA